MDYERSKWQSVKNDVHVALAPLEWISRKVLLYYTNYALIKLVIAIAGGAAVITAILDLSGRANDRLLRDLNLFVQIKEQASGESVSGLLKDLIERGLPPQNIPLSKVNMAQSNLDGAILDKGYFKEADLKAATFKNASLKKASFTEAWLNETDFSGANLSEADLTQSKGAWSKYNDATLEKARFDHSFLFMAEFKNANLKEASMFRSRINDGTLKGANAQGARFMQAELNGTDLSSTNFTDAGLEAVDFTGANMKGTNISGAKFVLYNDDGSIDTDEEGNELVAKITADQLKESCADPDNPPHLPKNEVLLAVEIPSCEQPNKKIQPTAKSGG